jgi:hypothetical protein
MALKLGNKTDGEVWIERLTAAFWCGSLLIVHVALFVALLARAPRSLAGGVGTVLSWLVWQEVSRIATGARFSLRLLAEDRTAREAYDVGFTCALAVNVVFFSYFIWNW